MFHQLRVLSQSWPFLLGLILGIYFIPLNIIGIHFTHFPGDLGDARFNTYILEHAHQFFLNPVASFWDAPFMYPEPKIITYSDNLLGSAPFYSFFRSLGFERETSFQWWFLMMFVMSYTCCYFFLNWYFKNKYAAVLGALIFAFSMALQSQMTHAQTFPRFPIPLAFWMSLLFIRDLKPVHFFAALFFVVFQFYCGMYLGFMLSIPIAIMLLCSVVFKWSSILEKIRNLKWLSMIFLSLIVNILIILPLILPYYERGKELGLNTYENIVNTLPTIKSYLFSQTGSLFWDRLNTTGIDYPAFWDHQIFPGGTAILCLLIFCFFIFSKLLKKDIFPLFSINKSLIIIFVTGFITALLFIRIQEYSIYKYVFFIPGFDSMRSLTRIINVELIFFAFAVAFVFTILLRKRNFVSSLLFIFFACLIILENYYKEGKSYRTEKAVSQKRVNELIYKLKDIPTGSIFSYEPPNIDNRPAEFQIDAMLAAQTLGLKTINGYSATSPYGYSAYWTNMDRKSRLEWLKVVDYSPEVVHVIH